MNKKLLFLPSLISLQLLVCAILHRLQLAYALGSYTESSLMTAELIFAVGTLILLLLQPIPGIWFLIKRRGKLLLMWGLDLSMTLLFFTAAVIIDAPTLLYGT